MSQKICIVKKNCLRSLFVLKEPARGTIDYVVSATIDPISTIFLNKNSNFV